MPTRTIATRIAVEGEKEFAKALKSAGREMRVLGSEMQLAQAEFETSGDKQTFLGRKTEILTGQLEQQREMVRALERNIKEMSDSWGKGSEDADKYAIELNKAKAKASSLEKELNQTKKELNGVDDGMEDATKESRTFARSMERNVEEAAEDSEKALRGLGGELENMREALDQVRSMEGVQLGMDIAGGLADTASSLFDYANEAREYNRQLAMLEINAANAKIDYSTAEAEAFEAASYLGDLDSALEGINELLAAGLDTTQFVQSIDLLTGAALRFPDTLKFESLADGLQETLATGTGAGQFGELLERLGVDIEAFNIGLADAKTRGDEVGYTLTYLSQHGLADTKRQFGETNASMVEAEAATLRLEKAWNSFGTAIDTVLTPLKNAGAWLLESASDMLSDTVESVQKHGIGGLFYSTADSGELADAPWMDPAEAEAIRQREAAQIEAAGGPQHQTTVWDWIFRGGKSVEEKQQEYLESIGAAPSSMVQDLNEELTTAAEEATTSGAAIPTNLAAGIDSSAQLAIDSTQTMVDQVQALLNSVVIPNYAAAAAATVGGMMGSQSVINASVILNGRKVGQMLTPTISTQQGMQMGN